MPDAIDAEQYIARSHPGCVRGTLLKHIEEHPRVATGPFNSPERGGDRVLGQEPVRIFMIEGRMATTKLGQEHSYTAFKSILLCGKQLRRPFVDEPHPCVAVHACAVYVVLRRAS